ncbi:AI-2E family transporter [Nocardia sp. XZ_19_385]|uniref:AI-2E family transporter n=1 Tax=Nocardia sp. XZ_19_385 TaxID=2769488 RepID=UPI002815FA22|nr:AI-2E family transporter [Nocardia sp. XZ_19_385]
MAIPPPDQAAADWYSTRRMPRWLPRAMVLAFILLGLFELGNWAVHRLLGLFVLVLVAFFVSLAMEPAVDSLAGRGMPRGLATGVVFVLLYAGVAGFTAALGVLLVHTVSSVVDELPRLLNEAVGWVNRIFHQDFTVAKLRARLTSESDVISGYAQRAANHAWGLSYTVLGELGRFLTVALFSIYFTVYGPRMRRAVCSWLPTRRQDMILRAWDLAIEKTGGYLYSRALLAVISAVAHALFLMVLGLPNAIELGICFGVIASFVPIVGTYLAGLLPILVALTIHPIDAVWILLFVVLYQVFQDYVLQPRITAHTVDVNPAIALLAVMAGGALHGAVGALLAIPAVATLQAFLSLYVKRYEVADDPRIDRVGHRVSRRSRRGQAAESPSPATEEPRDS